MPWAKGTTPSGLLFFRVCSGLALWGIMGAGREKPCKVFGVGVLYLQESGACRPGRKHVTRC